MDDPLKDVFEKYNTSCKHINYKSMGYKKSDLLICFSRIFRDLDLGHMEHAPVHMSTC